MTETTDRADMIAAAHALATLSAVVAALKAEALGEAAPRTCNTEERKTMSTMTWIDVETNGLDAHANHLLEVACLVTDEELNVLDEMGFQAVIYYPSREADALYESANEHVRKMHADTGLWDKLGDGIPLAKVDEQLLAYVAQFSAPRTSPVAGNSVRLDMNFMDAYLPHTASHLDYHMRDVSTIAGLASAWYDLPRYEKASDHTAMTDIRESIRELRHYRELIFRESFYTTKKGTP